MRLERSSAWLEPNHIKKISDAYWEFKDTDGFAKVMSNKDVLSDNNGILSVQLYVKQTSNRKEHETESLLSVVKSKQTEINEKLETLFTQLKDIGIEK